MRPFKYLPNYTVQDYRLWQGNWELIDGIAHAMSPSPFFKHQELGTLLLLQIGISLQKQRHKCKNCKLVYETDWIIDNTTVLCPDIALVCNNKGDFITSPPVLIIEILSSSTALKDRHVKFGIYEEQGVKYYIIVNPDTKTYTVYSLKDKHYVEQSHLKSFIIHDKCEIDLDIDNALSELEA